MQSNNISDIKQNIAQEYTDELFNRIVTLARLSNDGNSLDTLCSLINQYCPNSMSLIEESLKSLVRCIKMFTINTWQNIFESFKLFLSKYDLSDDLIDYTISELKLSYGTPNQKSIEPLIIILTKKKSQDQSLSNNSSNNSIINTQNNNNNNSNNNSNNNINDDSIDMNNSDEEEEAIEHYNNLRQNNRDIDKESSPFKKRNHVSQFLFIGNLSRKIDKHELLSTLRKYGQIGRDNIDLQNPRDAKPAQKFLHCFVKFNSIKESMDAVEGLSGKWEVQYSDGKKTNYIVLISDRKIDLDKVKSELPKNLYISTKLFHNEKAVFLNFHNIKESTIALRAFDKLDKVGDSPIIATYCLDFHEAEKFIDHDAIYYMNNKNHKSSSNSLDNISSNMNVNFKTNINTERSSITTHSLEEKRTILTQLKQNNVSEFIRVQPVVCNDDHLDIQLYIKRFGYFNYIQYNSEHCFTDIFTDKNDILNDIFSHLSNYVTSRKYKLYPSLMPIIIFNHLFENDLPNKQSQNDDQRVPNINYSNQNDHTQRQKQTSRSRSRGGRSRSNSKSLSKSRSKSRSPNRRNDDKYVTLYPDKFNGRRQTKSGSSSDSDEAVTMPKYEKREQKVNRRREYHNTNQYNNNYNNRYKNKFNRKSDYNHSYRKNI